MKIAVAQIQAFRGDVEKNIEKHLLMIDAARENHLDMIVFPELSLTGYEPQLAKALATTSVDVRLSVFQERSDASGLVIGLGTPIKGEDGLVHIGMIVFQAHQEPMVYCKQHLYPTEPEYFASKKNELLLIGADGTKVAPAICYELSVAEHSAKASEKGAEVYFASVLNSVNGVDGDLSKLSAIASKYGMITLMANYVGRSGGYDCAGKSSVWNTKGELLGQLAPGEEGLLWIDTQTMAVQQEILINA